MNWILNIKLLCYKVLKYRGPILRVTSPALDSDDLTLDQSAQVFKFCRSLRWSRDTFLFMKLHTYDFICHQLWFKIKSLIKIGQTWYIVVNFNIKIFQYTLTWNYYTFYIYCWKCIFSVFCRKLSLHWTAWQPYRLSKMNALCINWSCLPMKFWGKLLSFWWWLKNSVFLSCFFSI